MRNSRRCVLLALLAAGAAAAATGPTLVYSSVSPLAGILFFPPAGGALPSGTEAAATTAAATTGNVQNFFVSIFPAPGAGNSIAFTWRLAGASQSLSCTIAGGSTTCSDLVHSFTAGVGAAIDIQAVVTGAPKGTPSRVTFSTQFGQVPTIADIQQSLLTICYDGDDTHTVSFTCSRSPAGGPLSRGSTILFSFAASFNGANATVDVEGSGGAQISFSDGSAIPAGSLAGDESGTVNYYLLTFDSDDDLWIFANQLLPDKTAPMVTGCGAGAAIAGTDRGGVVTEGAGAAGCTLTFHVAYPAAARCAVSSQAGLGFTYSTTAAALTITNVGALSGTKLGYVCGGF